MAPIAPLSSVIKHERERFGESDVLVMCPMITPPREFLSPLVLLRRRGIAIPLAPPPPPDDSAFVFAVVKIRPPRTRPIIVRRPVVRRPPPRGEHFEIVRPHLPPPHQTKLLYSPLYFPSSYTHTHTHTPCDELAQESTRRRRGCQGCHDNSGSVSILIGGTARHWLPTFHHIASVQSTGAFPFVLCYA